jgi:GMP synthase-like glutamine amidotransferase
VAHPAGNSLELIAIDEGMPVPSSPSGYSGIGMMGGPMSVNDKLPWINPLCALVRDAISDGTPVIGHCLGGQMMSKALGARVVRMPEPEIGWLHVDVCDRGARREWFGGLPRFPRSSGTTTRSTSADGHAHPHQRSLR